MSRTLIGTYHKTLARDEATGYTYFLFLPNKGKTPTSRGWAGHLLWEDLVYEPKHTIILERDI